MLIDFRSVISKYQLKVTGIIHIGACMLEELESYNASGVTNIQWFEANPVTAQNALDANPGQRVITGALGSQNADEITLHVSNNLQSSSLLPFKTHSQEHPEVVYTHDIKTRLCRFDKLVEDGEADIDGFNFLNLDVQGVELDVLKGFNPDYFKKIDCIYSEVNENELYEGGCFVGELDEFLNQFGFQRVETKMLEFGWGDAVYIRKGVEICQGPAMWTVNCDAETNGELDVFYWLHRSNGFKTVFDVGARTDVYYAVDGVMVHAFDPLHAVELEKIVVAKGLVDRIRVSPVALGDKAGTLQICPTWESFVRTNPVNVHNIQVTPVSSHISVPVTTVADYMKENSIDHIDFMKIDVEGFEPNVIAGAKSVLDKIDFIQFEFGGTWPDGRKSLREAYNILDGWWIYQIQAGKLIECFTPFDPHENQKIENIGHWANFYCNFLASRVRL
jgi:FkbM family methyltransferase